jgi:bifunctional DNA-binding transcriptional regulator/antitoxin component of YhaV-PrlF toxin-antitoxin module
MNETLTLTVTAKGQITLKQSVLRHLGLKTGDSLKVHFGPEGSVTLRAAPRGDIRSFFGCLHAPPARRTPVSIEDMNDAIARGWAGER